MKPKTKAEAKQKWCPMARSYCSPGDADITANRKPNSGAADTDCLCLADGCGVWDDDGQEMRGDEVVDTGHCGLVSK